METRYYIKSEFTTGRPLTLFKMEIDAEAETMDALEWHDGWEQSDRLVKALIDRDFDFDLVTEEQARQFKPEAFEASATLVSKAVDERRFTLGPMYIPNRRDAHSEWTDPDELQAAVWDYVKKGDRRIRLQHDKETVAGEWVEVMAWPYEVDAPMMRKDGTTQNMTFPPNTVFLGVQWEPWAWELVKADKLRGYSIGGRAQRLLVDLPDESE